MLLTQVRGHVVASAKSPKLAGKKLLLVEILNPGPAGLTRTGRYLVCLDAVGAGEGQLTLSVTGSSARLAPGMNDVPTDGVIVGIVDAVQCHGQQLALAEEAQ
jgi:microcompartment protein CcmK/EutM